MSAPQTPYRRPANGATLWRQGANAWEVAEVGAIDERIGELETERSLLTRERAMITHRACQRARKRLMRGSA